MTGLLIAIASLLVVALAACLVAAIWRWNVASGTRLISCPQTQTPEAVELNRFKAIWATLRGRLGLELSQCSRWPEGANCAQECLGQITESQDGCRVQSILSEWYVGKSCVLCEKSFRQTEWFDHRPGLLRTDRQVFAWEDLEAKNLEETLKTHLPICWDCSVTEKFIKNYPERIILK